MYILHLNICWNAVNDGEVKTQEEQLIFMFTSNNN
jgi:hypothetical protein